MGSTIAFFLLTACSGGKLPAMDEEEANAIKENIKIVTDADNKVYGNIRLVTEMDGASIKWKASVKDVISTQDNGDLKAGVVTRQEEDTTVTLTANIEKDGKGATYTQDIVVAAAPEEIYDEDYVGYLFCHFTGQEGNVNHEQIYFALADEGRGLKFTDMNGATSNNLKPVLKSNVGDKGVRDPFIYRSPEGDTFRIIATDLSVKNRGGWKTNHDYTRKGSHCITMWESHDLVNWSEAQLLEVAAPDAGMAWAPEMIYHEETGQYVIFFSSTICNEDKSEILWRDCIYYTTTRDFVNFSETKKFIKNQPYPAGQTDPQTNAPNAYNNDERKIIDASLIKIDDWYYLAAKDGDNHENGGILVSRTQDIFDIESWEKMYELEDLGLSARVALNNKQLEGPEWFHYNVADRKDPEVDEIGLMGDMYMNGQGYLPLSTTDVDDRTNENESWSVLGNDEYDWQGLKKRHGSIMRLTEEEIAAVKELYNK